MITFIISLLVILGSAELWRKGGNGNKIWRFIGVPALITIGLLLKYLTEGWLILFLGVYWPALWGMLTLFTYGVNAPIHKFVVKIFGKGEDGNCPEVEVTTRAICGFGWSLAGIIVCLLTCNWLPLILYSIFLTIFNGLVGGLVKNVEKSERLVGAAVALSILL